MKFALALAALATAAVSVSGAGQSVEELFKSLKKAPGGHGHSELLSDGRVVSYDQEHNIVDSKQADKAAVAEYWEADRQTATTGGTKAGAKAASDAKARRRADDHDDAEVRDLLSSSSSESESVDLGKRLICGDYACDEDMDCTPYGCYGGCRNNFYGYLRCRP
ncbi:hypothetical protein F4778DRAFT_780064 [Xylariomycetidae sp. FL2044]|nr:hypothetical protein F4778DRAFT_780064 [Xylariomycetidae sp. FL2044]